MHHHTVACLSGMLLATSCTPPRPLPPDLPQRVPPVAAAEPLEQASAPNCVSFWPEARYRSYAYDHVVHLDSRCHRDASCSVSTNLAPKPLVVAVAPGERLEVITLRGSPTPDFTPDVQCSRGTR